MGIKRDKRNIGKMVWVNAPGTIYHGRKGKVVGFRGDYKKGDPFVEVFLYDMNGKSGSVWPFSGHSLETKGG